VTRDEILAKARTESDGSIDAVIDIARADERARIVGYLFYEADMYDKLERSGGALRSQSAAGTRAWAAQKIEDGEPS
jgi:hypothetical protein